MYLRNRSPTKAVSEMTPYEALHGRKPNVGHLRVFGCSCFAHIPRDERRKLDVVSRRCVFVGYGSEVKGYRLFDPAQRRVFFSRDVKFNDQEVGRKKKLCVTDPLIAEPNVVEPSVVDPNVVEPSVELNSELNVEPESRQTVRKSMRARHR